MSVAQMKVWHKHFKDGQEPFESDPRSGTSATSRTSAGCVQTTVNKVPTGKTEASLSYVQCFFHLVSSLVNVYFSYHMAGYLLDRPYTPKCICTYISLQLNDEVRNPVGTNFI